MIIETNLKKISEDLERMTLFDFDDDERMCVMKTIEHIEENIEGYSIYKKLMYYHAFITLVNYARCFLLENRGAGGMSVGNNIIIEEVMCVSTRKLYSRIKNSEKMAIMKDPEKMAILPHTSYFPIETAEMLGISINEMGLNPYRQLVVKVCPDPNNVPAHFPDIGIFDIFGGPILLMIKSVEYDGCYVPYNSRYGKTFLEDVCSRYNVDLNKRELYDMGISFMTSAIKYAQSNPGIEVVIDELFEFKFDQSSNNYISRLLLAKFWKDENIQE